jgi:hypothetical protein
MANLYLFVGDLSEAQLIAIVQDLSSANIKENKAAFSILYSRYAEINPTAALDFAMTNIADQDLKNALLSTSLINLASQDPLAAYERFVSLTSSRQSTAGIKKMQLSGSLIATFSSLAKQDLSLAIDKLNEIIELGYSARMPVMGLTDHIDSKQDFVDLLVLTEALNNHVVEEGIIDKWASQNPEQVSDWLLEEYAGENLERLKDSFVRAWSYHDREGSGNWLVDNTASDKVGQKVVKFLDSWSWDNPEAAMQWFSKQPNAVYNQKTFSEFINDAAFLNPQFATKYMSYLDGEKPKEELAKRIYQGFKRNSTQQANDFLEQSPFKDEILEFDEYMKNSL